MLTDSYRCGDSGNKMAVNTLALVIIATCLYSSCAQPNGRRLEVLAGFGNQGGFGTGGLFGGGTGGGKTLPGGRTFRGPLAISQALQSIGFDSSQASAIVSFLSAGARDLTAQGRTQNTASIQGNRRSTNANLESIAATLSVPRPSRVTLLRPSRNINVPLSSTGRSGSPTGRKLTQGFGTCAFSTIQAGVAAFQKRARFTVNGLFLSQYWVVGVHYYYDCNFPWACQEAIHVAQGPFSGTSTITHSSDFDFGFYLWHQVIVYGFCNNVVGHQYV